MHIVLLLAFVAVVSGCKTGIHSCALYHLFRWHGSWDPNNGPFYVLTLSNNACNRTCDFKFITISFELSIAKIVINPYEEMTFLQRYLLFFVLAIAPLLRALHLVQNCEECSDRFRDMVHYFNLYLYASSNGMKQMNF